MGATPVSSSKLTPVISLRVSVPALSLNSNCSGINSSQFLRKLRSHDQLNNELYLNIKRSGIRPSARPGTRRQISLVRARSKISGILCVNVNTIEVVSRRLMTAGPKFRHRLYNQVLARRRVGRCVCVCVFVL